MASNDDDLTAITPNMSYRALRGVWGLDDKSTVLEEMIAYCKEQLEEKSILGESHRGKEAKGIRHEIQILLTDRFSEYFDGRAPEWVNNTAASIFNKVNLNQTRINLRREKESSDQDTVPLRFNN